MQIILGDSRNDMPPILVPFSAKRITTQILVIQWMKIFYFERFVCDIIQQGITPSKLTTEYKIKVWKLFKIKN